MREYKFHLEVHDFGFLLPGLPEIIRLKDIYPGFKITCFTVPLPKEFYGENAKHFKLDKYKKWAEIINSYDWLEIGMHGFSHTHNEMDVGYDKAVEIITAGEKLFEKVGLNYRKIFVAPYWQYSYDAFHALKDKGYIVGMNPEHPRPYPEGMKNFFYNWSYEKVLPGNKNVIGHGHTTGQGVKNGLKECYNNMINLIPKDAEFGSLTDYIKQQYEENHKESRTEDGGGGQNLPV
jgi:hypothetical protein